MHHLLIYRKSGRHSCSRAAGHGIAGGAGETSSTVGIVGIIDAAGAGGGFGRGAGSPGNTPSTTCTVAGGTGLGGGGGSGAGSLGNTPEVLVQVLIFCFVVTGFRLLLCRRIPSDHYAQHVGMFAFLTFTCI